MGKFYLRVPASKTTGSPEHWQLISDNLGGPPAAGQLKLGTYNGWAKHVPPSDPNAALLRLRNRNGKNWLPVLYMDTNANYYILQYQTSNGWYNNVVFDENGNESFPFSSDDYRGAFADAEHYSQIPGWQSNRMMNYDWRRQDQNNPVGPGVAVPTETYSDGTVVYPRGERLSGNSSQTMWAQSTSSVGWTGDENSTYRRYMEEWNTWYSIPIGMFCDDAETYRLTTKINSPESWAKTAVLARVDIVHQLRGYSVDKSQVPWMNQYNSGQTTNGLWPGIGALRYAGLMPTDVSETYTFHTGVYTVPVFRDVAFQRDDQDEILWTGSLNDVGGVFGNLHGLDQLLTNFEGIDVTQSFDMSAGYDSTDAAGYQLQVSPLPDPDPIVFGQGDNDRTLVNYLFDVPLVRVFYAFDNG